MRPILVIMCMDEICLFVSCLHVHSAWELRYCEEIIQASDGVAMFNGRGKKWESTG